MRYTVTALPTADDELIEIWLAASKPSDITQTFHVVEQRLRSDLLRDAHPDGDDFWLIIPPLAVLFSFSPDDCMVCILRVTTVE